MQRPGTTLARSVRVASAPAVSFASALLLVTLAILAFAVDLARATDGTWIEIPPPTRRDHTAILDPGHDRMLVFGGYEGDVPRAEVYALSLATSEWTKIYVPGVGPSPRVGHSAIYDPVRNRMIIFGGNGNDVWALSHSDPAQWTPIAVQGTPPSARSQHTAIYDPVTDRMLVFGGWSAGYKNDIWALSLAGTPTWTQITPNGPLPVGRSAPTAILDPIRRRMLVFGGRNNSVLDDLWALSLDGTPVWTAIVPLGSRPLPTYEHVAVYDAGHDRMIVSGGNNGDLYPTQDCWALPLTSGASWERFPMHYRAQHSGIYDSVRDAMVVYGGLVIYGHDNATWRLALAATPNWQLVTSSGQAVMRQLQATTIHDPVGNRMIAFGGNGSGCIDPCPSGYTASYSLVDRRWTWLNNGPERYDHSAIYDPIRHRMLVFGGSDFYVTPTFNDTWELSLPGTPNWSQLTPAGTPPAPRRAHTAVYDPVGDRMLVFGGIDSNFEVGPRFNDVWQLSLGGASQWTALAPLGVPPSPRENHTAIYDPIGARMLVFAGRDANGLKNDLWALSLTGTPAWTLIMPAGIPPSPREGHTAIFDPVRTRMIVFGGSSDDEIWSLDLASSETLAWSLFDADGIAPAGSQEHAAIYDPLADQMVVCGGWSSGMWQDLGSSAVTVLTLQDVAAVPAAAAPTPGLVLLNARPNPASGAFEVLFETARARPAVLELIDVAGRRIARQELGMLTPGSHRVRFDDIKVPAGTYFLRLTQNGRSTSSKIALVP